MNQEFIDYTIDNLLNECKQSIKDKIRDDNRKVVIEGSVTSVKSFEKDDTSTSYIVITDNQKNDLTLVVNHSDTVLSKMPSRGDQILAKGKVGIKKFLKDSSVEFACFVDTIDIIKSARVIPIISRKKKTLRPYNGTPYSIAIITGEDTEGYNDVLSVFENKLFSELLHDYQEDYHEMITSCFTLKCNYFCNLTNPNDIANQINIASENEADIIMLFRGGGSESELSIFNYDNIIDQLIFSNSYTAVAIGHKRNRPRSQEVADLEGDTPNDLAQMILRRMISNVMDYVNPVKNLSVKDVSPSPPCVNEALGFIKSEDVYRPHSNPIHSEAILFHTKKQEKKEDCLLENFLNELEDEDILFGHLNNSHQKKHPSLKFLYSSTISISLGFLLYYIFVY